MARQGLGAWLAAQAWRARMLARDVVRLTGGGLRTLAWTVAPERRGPALAMLSGEPLARAGEPAVYRVRVHNPGAHASRVAIVLRGRSTEQPSSDFEVRWDATLDPGTAADWWLRSRWRGDVELLPECPTTLVAPWVARPAGRWTVLAHLHGPDGRERDRLVIGGTFTS